MGRARAKGDEAVAGWLPLLGLRGVVLFPDASMTITVGRPATLRMVADCRAQGTALVAAALRDASVDAPAARDFHGTGVLATVEYADEPVEPDDPREVVLRGRRRVRLVACEPGAEPRARAEPLPDLPDEASGEDLRRARDLLRKTLPCPPWTTAAQWLRWLADLAHEHDAGRAAYMMAAALPSSVADWQRVLEIRGPGARVAHVRRRLEALRRAAREAPDAAAFWAERWQQAI